MLTACKTHSSVSLLCLHKRLPQEPQGLVILTCSQVAIIGRPNVGKSALFNRLVRKKEALVGTARHLLFQWNMQHGVSMQRGTHDNMLKAACNTI